MASPNDKNFQASLTSHLVDEARSAYEILKKWARHDDLIDFHRDGKVPCVVYLEDLILIEYGFHANDVGKDSLRIWEDLYGDLPTTMFESAYSVGSETAKGDLGGETSFMAKVREALANPETGRFRRDNSVEIEDEVKHARSCREWDVEVDEVIKKRSVIAQEVFEILVHADNVEALEKCEEIAKPDVDGMIELSEEKKGE